MDREIVLSVLVLVIAGPLALAFGWWPRGPSREANARLMEDAAWTRVWAPLAPAGLALVALLGWALVEPENAEPVSWPYAFAALPFAAMLARVVVRSVWSLRGTGGESPAATLGLVFPRVVLSPRLEAALDVLALAAAREHETAHARHRDPLRLWLAQVATDLQWPWPEARARLATWSRVLELARDEEARARGVDGADLAAAIMAAVRLGGPAPTPLMARITGSEAALRERIARLLAPFVSDSGPRRIRVRIALLTAGILAVVLLGAEFGETLVFAILGAPR